MLKNIQFSKQGKTTVYKTNEPDDYESSPDIPEYKQAPTIEAWRNQIQQQIKITQKLLDATSNRKNVEYLYKFFACIYSFFFI